jgi:hypothetical protein
MKRTISTVLLLLACGPSVPVGQGETGADDDGLDDAADSSPTSQTDPTMSTSMPTTLTSGDPTGNDVTSVGPTDEGDVTDDEGMTFITPDDFIGAIECDIWADDCPVGTKCMPWANDGGNAWNATTCSPLAEDPHEPGEPCTVEGNGVSGIDDCEARAMCWNVDEETNMGECVAFCSGSEANPVCKGACETCPLSAEGVLILCLPNCDPLAQDCDDGQGCYPWADEFICSPDAGGAAGGVGEPCEYTNVCDPGTACIPAEQVPGCEGSYGCCSPYCDAGIGAPCPAELEGTECIPWLEDGEAPPCAAGIVGVCALPE